MHHEINNKMVNTILTGFREIFVADTNFPVSLQYRKFHGSDKKK